MKKAIVIGCPGSGKTTFAEKLHTATGLPLCYLDAIWHKADRTHITREKFDARLTKILNAPEWIIDGNYSRTLERRLACADTVFWFDLPAAECLRGVTERLGKVRPDMPFTDTVLDPYLKEEIETFGENGRPQIEALVRRYGEGKKIVIFHSRTEADAFLNEINGKTED